MEALEAQIHTQDAQLEEMASMQTIILAQLEAREVAHISSDDLASALCCGRATTMQLVAPQFETICCAFTDLEEQLQSQDKHEGCSCHCGQC